MKQKNSSQRKQRITEIRIAFDSEVDIEMTSPENGTISFIERKTKSIVEPKEIATGLAYERPKGHKVLARANQNPSTIFLDLNQTLTNYDHVFAIDTNTDPQTHKSVSVFMYLLDLRYDNAQWKFEPRYPPAFIFNSDGSSPEKIGWCNAIRRITASSDIRGSIAIFVDSELGRLSAINSKKESILDNFFLPDVFELIYASSDAGTEELIGNLAIKNCDRVARKILKQDSTPIKLNEFYYFTVPVSILV